MFITRSNYVEILSLNILKHAEMGCQKSADPESPRVKKKFEPRPGWQKKSINFQTGFWWQIKPTGGK